MENPIINSIMTKESKAIIITVQETKQKILIILITQILTINSHITHTKIKLRNIIK